MLIKIVRQYKWKIVLTFVVVSAVLLIIHNHRLTKDYDSTQSLFFDAEYFFDEEPNFSSEINALFKRLVTEFNKGSSAVRNPIVSDTIRLYLEGDYWLPSVFITTEYYQVESTIRHKTKYRGDKKVKQDLRRVCLVINNAIAQNFAHQIQSIKVRYLVWKPPVNPEKSGGAAIPVKEKILRADELSEVCNYMDWLYAEKNETNSF